MKEKLTYKCFLEFSAVGCYVFTRVFTDEHHLSDVRFCLGVTLESFGELATEE